MRKFLYAGAVTVVLLFALFMAVTSYSSSAEAAKVNKFDTSAYWLNECQDPNSDVCAAFVMGMRRGSSATVWMLTAIEQQVKATRPLSDNLRKLTAGCKVSTTTYGEMIQVWVKYLTDTPNILRERPRYTFIAALLGAYPCKGA